MPLPDSTPLSLQVPPNLGNAVQSRPKRAMIVRMSAETLEALEAFPNQPQMNFEFGDNPGIYIGETFFPMRPQKESSPHEIYLRASSAAKPNAPLKLYANVIGKFMVERQLGEKVTDKVRQQTMVAKQQHLERKAILLDQPPIPVPGAKNKRKLPGSGTVVKKAPASDQLRVPSSGAVPPRKVSPLPQNPPSSKASADVRRRLVHCLAIQPRLAEDAVRMVGGQAISASAREDLLALLEDVAEQQAPTKKGDKSPRPWILKPQTWTEVRPYEWGKLSEQERHAMARQGRMVFKALKIPETDSVWDHVRFRPNIPASTPPPVTTTSSRSSATASSAPPPAEVKRPAVPKPKARNETSRTAKGEILMKDEGIKASRVNAIKRVEAERHSSSSDSVSSAKPPVTRRLPGSGYQAKKSPQPGATASTAESPPRKPAVPVETRAPQRQPPTSLPPKPAAAPPPAASQARKTIPTLPPKTSRKSDESDRERDLEREREKQRGRGKDKESDRDMDRARVKEKDRISKEDRTTSIVGIKRKNAMQDIDDVYDKPLPKTAIPKKRKLEDGASVTSSSSSSKIRDPQLPKKPVYEPSTATRHRKAEEPPSLPASARGSFSSQDRPSPSSFSTKVERSKTNGTTTKGRRKSPIYTSSEDEGEIPQPRKREATPLPPLPPPPTLDRPPANGKASHHRPRNSYPLPTDHAALRARYQSSYADYLGAFSKVVAQKRKIEAILNGESEGEVDVMDPEELMKLSIEHKTLKEELENIHEMYTRGTTHGSTSD